MKKILIPILITMILGVSVFGFFEISQPDKTAKTQTEQVTVDSEKDINISNEGKTVEYSGEEGVTALKTLKSLTDVETKDSDFGEFVTSINGVEADESQEYWSFYVNDDYANEGASTYTAEKGDVFKWQIEALE